MPSMPVSIWRIKLSKINSGVRQNAVPHCYLNSHNGAISLQKCLGKASGTNVVSSLITLLDRLMGVSNGTPI